MTRNLFRNIYWKFIVKPTKELFSLIFFTFTSKDISFPIIPFKRIINIIYISIVTIH